MQAGNCSVIGNFPETTENAFVSLKFLIDILANFLFLDIPALQMFVVIIIIIILVKDENDKIHQKIVNQMIF